MPEAFICPSCNAPLEYESNGDPVIQCRYCDTPVIVPDGLLDGHHPTPEQAAGHQPGTTLRPDQLANLKQIVQLARGGRTIDAIRLYRETFHVGLKEAKETVDRIVLGESVVFSSTSPTTNIQAKHPTIAQPTRKSNSAGRLIILILGFLMVVGIGVILALFFLFSSSSGPQITTSNGSIASLQMTIGAEGTGAGLFNDARWIALDGDGNIFIVEYDTGRIQVFTPSGEFLTMWTIDSDKHITGLAVSRNGTVYLTYGQEIHIYDGTSGEKIGTLDFTEGDGFEDIFTTADDNIYAFRSRFSDDIVHFNPEGNVVKVIKEAISGQTGDNEMSLFLAVDGLGNIFALGQFNEGVFKFSPDGKFLTRFGSEGDQPGQFNAPRAIAVDGQSRVYIGDTRGIHIFDSNGRYIDSLKDVTWCDDLIFNYQNELFVLQRTEIKKYNIQLP